MVLILKFKQREKRWESDEEGGGARGAHQLCAGQSVHDGAALR